MLNATLKHRQPTVILGILASAALATAARAELLENVPAKAALVIVVRDPDALSGRLTRLVRKIKPDSQPMTVDRMFNELGLPAGTISGRKPVAIVINSADDVYEPPVIVFQPLELGKFMVTADASSAAPVAKITLNGAKPRFVSIQNGWAVVGPRAQSVRRVLRSAEQSNLLNALGDQERAVYEKSDTFLHLSMDEWQGKVTQALGIMRLIGTSASMASDSPDGQVHSVVLEWLANGLGRVAADMDSTALAFTLDDHGARFTHFHSFKPKSRVAQYLGRLKMADVDPWIGLNRRPFLAAFAWNWSNPDDASIMADFMKKISAIPGLCADADKAANDKFVRACESYYRKLETSAAVFDLTPDRHLRLSGTSRFPDAAEGMRLIREISLESSQLMSSFAPTWACDGDFSESKRDGLDISAMSFASRQLPPRERAMVDALYGPNAAYELAAIDDHIVGYSVSPDPNDIVRLARAAQGKIPAFSAAPGVAEMLTTLPEHPCLVAIADVDRVTRFAPYLASLDSQIDIQVSPTKSDKDKAAPKEAPAKESGSKVAAVRDNSQPQGPLIGWALVTGPTWIRGELVMTEQDVVRSVPLVQRMSQILAASDDAQTTRTKQTRIKIERRGSR